MKLNQKPKWEHFKFQLIYKLLDIIKLTKKFCEESLKNGDRKSFNKIEALGKVDKRGSSQILTENKIIVEIEGGEKPAMLGTWVTLLVKDTV